MGVLSCSRPGCTSIMCNTYHPDHGYICNECQEEFKHSVGVVNGHGITNLEIEDKLNEFMETEKGTYLEVWDHKNIDSYFNDLTHGL